MSRSIDPVEHKALTLDLLIAFSEVCEANNLRYILDFGTLLGAIRHDGFIPWDDDIDVSMPRKDYERLIQLYTADKKIFGEYIKLASVRTDYNVYKPYFNLVDIRTKCVSNVRKEKYWYPIWIDIFPMDSVLESKAETEKKRKVIRKYRDLIGIGISKVPDSANIGRRIYCHIAELLERLFLKKIEKICTSRGSDKDIITTYYYSDKSDSDISLYNNYDYHMFENHSFRIPIEYDRKLRKLYGDYMKLPDEKDRVFHTTGSFWVSGD